MQRRILSGALIFLCLIPCICSAFAQTELLNLSIVINDEYAFIGRPVTATYSIKGGSEEYTKIATRWTIKSAGGTIDTDWEYHQSTTGSVTYIPTVGDTIQCVLLVNDSEERYISEWTEAIEILDSIEAEELSIEISTDKNSVKAGQPITATYSVKGGSEEYTKIATRWTIKSAGGTIDTDWEYHQSTTGSVTYIPMVGDTIQCVLLVNDSEERYTSKWTEVVEITDSVEKEKLNVEIFTDKNIVNIGQPITATYSVRGGSGEYTIIGTRWTIESAGGTIDTEWEYHESVAGTITYIPTIGETIQCVLLVNDTENRYTSKWTTAVEIKHEDNEVNNTPTPTVTPRPTPTATPTATLRPTPTATPTATPSSTPVAPPTAIPSVAPVVSPTVKPNSTPTETATATPTPDYSPNGGIFDGESDFSKLPAIKVPVLVLPDGAIYGLDLTLKFNGPNKEEKNNIKYDVHLVDSDGKKVELPSECILCFPYPEGMNETNALRYRIMIHHFGDNGMEKFDTKDGTIKLTPQGLCIRVSSLSPFVITWEELEVNLPQTGDSTPLMLYGVGMLLSLATVGLLKRRTKRI